MGSQSPFSLSLSLSLSQMLMKMLLPLTLPVILLVCLLLVLSSSSSPVAVAQVVSDSSLSLSLLLLLVFSPVFFFLLFFIFKKMQFEIICGYNVIKRNREYITLIIISQEREQPSAFWFQTGKSGRDFRALFLSSLSLFSLLFLSSRDSLEIWNVEGNLKSKERGSVQILQLGGPAKLPLEA